MWRFLKCLAMMMMAIVPAHADECKQPVYRGVGDSTVLRFLGTNELEGGERGVIETVKPHYVFKFTTTFSNGFSRESLLLQVLPKGETIDSVVMRKQADFTAGEGSTAYMITPDLPVNFYYATNGQGSEALHKVFLPDTWKRISCGGH
ncbi:hypothetical protein [Beijerinckia sp. L45]|uniref:hypothetical protein n=1 Tax=Beijerinckia sp. L45 TaxID=1641855 RepID=UPI00131B62ED|nr:hypothetical protein [Beijerinckia sp. L45]